MGYIRVQGVGGTLRALKLLDRQMAEGLGKEVLAIGKAIASDAQGFATNRPLTINGSQMTGWRGVEPTQARGERNSDGSYGARISRSGRGWPAWSETGIDASIKGSRREYVVIIKMADAAAFIYEWAGSKSQGKSPQGRAFIRNLPPLGGNGKYGRILVRALRKNYKQAHVQLADVVDRAVAAFNQKMGQ